MSMKTIASALYLLYRAKVPVLLEGVHGIGKTSALYQLHARVRKELGQTSPHDGKGTLDGRNLAEFSHPARGEFGLWAVSAANLTIEELIGYPQATPEGALRYLRSSNFLPPMDHVGGGIWDVDELNLGTSEVERAVMSIALEGRYLDYVMPEGIFICTSQNPATGAYQSRRLNPPTLNRFCQIKALASAPETIAYFESQNFHESILEALAEHSDSILNPHQAKCDFKIEQEPTSRSWEYVNRVMSVITPDELASVGQVVFTGLLGLSSAAVFMKYANQQGERSIPVDEILNDYGFNLATYDIDKTSLKDWPMPAVRKKVKKVCRSASVRVDIINIALQSLVTRLTTMGDAIAERKKESKEKNATTWDIMTDEEKTKIGNVFAFLCDIPPDQSGPAFLRQLKGNAFKFTMEPFGEHLIMDEYSEHWKQINDDMKKEQANAG